MLMAAVAHLYKFVILAKRMDWVQYLEREKKRLKSQLYKEMLDNQILLNRHLKLEQLTKANSSISRKSNLHSSKPHPRRHQNLLYSKRLKQNEQAYQSLLSSDDQSLLPSLQDQPQFYQPASRYRSIDQLRPHKLGNRMGVDLESGSESSVDQIIKQMQVINDRTSRNNRSYRRSKYNRVPKQQTAFRSNNAQTLATELKYGNPQHSSSLKSKSAQKKGGKVDFLSTFHNQKLQKLKSVLKDPPNPEPNTLLSPLSQPKCANQRTSASTQRQRDKFMQILKKVNTRGRNLLLKLSNFPSPLRNRE